MIHRFAQLKEEEKKKKLLKALPVEEVQPLASASASNDVSDVENIKVNIQLQKFLGHKLYTLPKNPKLIKLYTGTRSYRRVEHF